MDHARPHRWSGLLARPAARLLLLLAACLTVGLVESTQVYVGAAVVGEPIPWSRALSGVLPSWFVLALLVPVVVWLSRRFPLNDTRWRTSAAAHGAASVLFAAVHIGVASWLTNFVFSDDPPGSFGAALSYLLSLYFVTELLFYWAIVGAAHAAAYYRRYRERERETARLALEASRLEASLAQANLHALRMQLHPHFLFNTLNAVSTLALKGEREAVVRTLNRLSELLRLTLDTSAPVVTVREELELLERYLEVEQVRFGDRLTVRTRVDPDALGAEVPTLLLQPIVENAIRHGIARRSGDGRLDIAVRRRGERLELEVTDDGEGFPPHLLVGEGRGRPATSSSGTGGEGRSGRHGIGLANVRARLERLYPGVHVLELGAGTVAGARVRIEIPFRCSDVVETAPLAG